MPLSVIQPRRKERISAQYYQVAIGRPWTPWSQNGGTKLAKWVVANNDREDTGGGQKFEEWH